MFSFAHKPARPAAAKPEAKPGSTSRAAVPPVNPVWFQLATSRSAGAIASSAGSIQTKRDPSAIASDAGEVGSAARVAQSGGEPLPGAVRSFFEPRFGHDFSDVRVHTDGVAADAARGVAARAFTLREHVVFGQGQFAPESAAGQHLLAHELAHVVQQREGAGAHDGGAPALHGASPRLQRQDDPTALRARLAAVQARLTLLRALTRQSTDDFAGSVSRERQRESLQRITEGMTARARSESAGRGLWGGFVTAASVRRCVTATQSGNTVTLAVPLQITYLALPDADARQQAATDIPRIQAAIRDAWQVDIQNGEYAGIQFRMTPTVTYLPRGTARAANAFLIEVRGTDSNPSAGEPVGATISLARAHLAPDRVRVVAHELAHLFGFMDTYSSITSRGTGGQPREQWTVARPENPGQADLLGLIDPAVLARLQRQGAVTAQDVARQTGPVHIWEGEASQVLRTLGLAPPVRRPTPDSEDFDPAVELDRERRERETQLGQIRERRRRAEGSIEWLQQVEEIMRLQTEERELQQRLGITPPVP